MSHLLLLFVTFFKIGLFTIGGGYAMIPLIREEVIGRGWLSAQSLTDFIAVSESTPGPFAVNIATFVGFDTAGLAGALCSTLGVILPSFLIILFVAKFFLTFSKNRWVQAAMGGIRPVVLGLIVGAAYSIASGILVIGSYSGFASLLSIVDWKAVIICVVCCVMQFKFKVKAIPLIGSAAAMGLLLYGVAPLIGW